MHRCYIILLIFAGITVGMNVYTQAYSPEISGDLEAGDRLYFDTDTEEELLDKYYYQKLWLRYKQQLAVDEYYYLKGQVYLKEYDIKTTYNNKTLDLWGNYTKRLTDRIRNRWKINLKDKGYYLSEVKSYKSYRLNYQLDFDYDKNQRYSFYIQRQWNDYIKDDNKDYIRDRLSLNWRYKVNDSLQLNSSGQLEKQTFKKTAESSNKQGKKLSIGFKYKL
ncbi:MAG: hypothetical protein ACOCRL_01825 [Bacillota bacterium]